MGNDQIGVPLQELLKIEQDWRSISQRMGQLTQELGKIHQTIERATEVDLASSALAGLPGFGIAFEVLKDVKDIEGQAKTLMTEKERLTKELAGDADKIKAVKAEYEAIEKAIEDELKKIKHPVEPPKQVNKPTPGPHQPDGGGGGGGQKHHPGQPGSPGHGNEGGGDGGPGSTGEGPTPPSGHGTGDWAVHGSWDAWKPGTHHTSEGAGVQTPPKMDGLSQDRKDVLDRALERINHRIGYSQSATQNGYRDDCSGFVSAAWGLPGPGLVTTELWAHNVSHRINKDDLQPGDAMIAAEHVVLFGGWADAAHTRYIALEDNGSQGTVSHVIPYPYYPGSGPYYPFRKNGM